MSRKIKLMLGIKMGKVKEQNYNYNYLKDSKRDYINYGSSICYEHVEISWKYNMNSKEVLMFGWYLCQAYENNELNGIEKQEWFQIFIKENGLIEYKGD